MKSCQNSFKLIIAGNKNVPAMVNVIIRATLQLRENEQDKNLTFRQVYIFHTEESLHALMSSPISWHEELQYYGISTTSLIHHVTKLEDLNDESFRDLVEQLRTIVNPLDNAHYYVDLTGGLSSLKAILAVFAYVLDIENIYSLEVQFSSDFEERKRQINLFYRQLEQKGVDIVYRKFPPIRKFDEFGKRNYTEILRHRQIINELINNLACLLSPEFDFDLEYLQTALLSGVNFRLLGEVTEEVSNYRHSVFSFSAGVEEVANIILRILEKTIENKTLGQKLGEVRDLFMSNPMYFINEDVLKHLTRLTAEIRNDIVHPSSVKSKSGEILAIESYLSSHLASALLQFAINAITSFLDQDGKLVNVQILDPQQDTEETLFYFGFDGDSTGRYLEVAFSELNLDESEVLKRSQTIRTAIKDLSNLIKKRTKDNNCVFYAEGDNILFKARYKCLLINEIQRVYKERTGLCSSIGYGKTLQEATIALRLAKAKRGDSVVGVSITK